MSLALIAALLLQGAAATPQRPPASSADLPAWSKTPSKEDMARAYPSEAAKANLAGSATVECTVGATGDLTACVPVGESVPGFGQAAMSLASKFQLPLKSPSGATTVGRTVRFPVQWLNSAKVEAPLIQVYDDAGRSGSVVFNCRVRDDRKVDNCVAIDARPRGTQLFAYAGEQVMRATAPRSVDPGGRVLMVVEVRPNAR
jgi:TonB family protein